MAPLRGGLRKGKQQDSWSGFFSIKEAKAFCFAEDHYPTFGKADSRNCNWSEGSSFPEKRQKR
jgi:hypothetical protein